MIFLFNNEIKKTKKSGFEGRSIKEGGGLDHLPLISPIPRYSIEFFHECDFWFERV